MERIWFIDAMNRCGRRRVPRMIVYLGRWRGNGVVVVEVDVKVQKRARGSIIEIIIIFLVLMYMYRPWQKVRSSGSGAPSSTYLKREHSSCQSFKELHKAHTRTLHMTRRVHVSIALKYERTTMWIYVSCFSVNLNRNRIRVLALRLCTDTYICTYTYS
ncbi:hypothetical protein F5Y05DRAFT_95476 [Hypoxylon sp. FL0543]|nr:hypothetical protein F5Y05DRAFT_95476 [Hypoxylon sp. FL0543]